MSAPEPSSGAWLIGTNYSGSGVSYKTAGMEELIWNPNKRANFIYSGEGSVFGTGASASAYFGRVFNIKDPSQYRGPFASTGITISKLETGVTIGYFWDSSHRPFDPGIIHGFFVGYAPGAQASWWYSSTVYEETYSTEDNP